MIILNEISTIQDCKTVIEMIKKSKPLSHEPLKVSRLAFAHPVILGQSKFLVLTRISKPEASKHMIPDDRA